MRWGRMRGHTLVAVLEPIQSEVIDDPGAKMFTQVP